ncbi:cysteine hydrolase family protein [Chloroflexota bacterium]
MSKQKLLDFFRKNKLRIIYTTSGSEMPDYSDIIPHLREAKKLGGKTKGNRAHEILDELKPLPGECVVNKLTQEAFSSSNIDSVLRAMGVKHILFTGVSTTNCVEGTFRGAVDHGYRCLAVEDGCGDWTQEEHGGGVMRFRRMGRAETTDNVVKELYDALRKETTPQSK